MPHVVPQPKQHPTHIQVCMTLPTPLLAIFSTLQGAQYPDTTPILQSAKNASSTTLPPRLTNTNHLNLKHPLNIYPQQLNDLTERHSCESAKTSFDFVDLSIPKFF